MDDLYDKLCLLLLEEYFGSIVQCIGNNLLYGTKTLRTIYLETRLPVAKVINDIAAYYILMMITVLYEIYIFLYIINILYSFTKLFFC